MSTTKGRANRPTSIFVDTIKAKSAEQGMLQTQDAIIDALKAIAAKLDLDAGVTDTDYASTITDSLSKVDLQ